MTFRNFWIDLWHDIRYGHWYVGREWTFFYGRQKWGWSYFAIHSRTGERIDCVYKQIAEGTAAIENDNRGQDL